MKASIALLLALSLTGLLVAQPPHDEPVLVRIGDHVFDPTNRDAQDRFGMTAEPPDESVGWVLQFERPLNRGERNRLRTEYGLSLEDFVPDQAYLVWMPQLDIDRLAGTEEALYRGHVRYGPSLRLPAWLQAIADTPGSIQLRITTFDAIDVAELADQIRQLDPQRVDILQIRDRRGTSHLAVEMPLRLVRDLENIEGVRRVEDLPFRSEDRAMSLGGHPPTPNDPFVVPIRDEETVVSSAASVGEPPRHWTEVLGGFSFGRDSNVELVGKGSTTTGSKRDSHFLGYARVDYRRTAFEAGRKAWELGFQGGTTWIDQQEIDSASRFDWNVSGYLDWVITHVKRDAGGKLLQPGSSAGLFFRHAEFRLNEEEFATVNQAVLGGSINFTQIGECELNRVFAYVSFEDVDDRLPEPDPALNRNSRNTAIGIRGSLGPNTKKFLPHGWYCQGGGTFRKLFLQNYWTMHGTVQHRWERTDGTEFRRRADIVSLEGHWPLYRTTTPLGLMRSWLVLDADLSYTQANHSQTSIFAPESREDNVRVIDVGLIVPLVLQSEYLRMPRNYADVSLRVGGQYTDHRSNIDVFEYERTVYGISLQILFGHMNLNALRITLPDNPGSTDGNDSGSGPERPNPDGGTMMPSPPP